MMWVSTFFESWGLNQLEFRTRLWINLGFFNLNHKDLDLSSVQNLESLSKCMTFFYGSWFIRFWISLKKNKVEILSYEPFIRIWIHLGSKSPFQILMDLIFFRTIRIWIHFGSENPFNYQKFILVFNQKDLDPRVFRPILVQLFKSHDSLF